MAIAGNKLVNLAGAKVLYDDLRARIEALEADIATEDSATATAAHAVGDIILVDGALYSVTAAIAIGDTITAEGNSANVEATTVAAVIEAAVSGVIDDTAGDGDTAKTWSADKLHDELGSVPTIDDTAGDGDTDKVYSADKVHDLVAVKANASKPVIDGNILVTNSSSEPSWSVSNIPQWDQSMGYTVGERVYKSSGYNKKIYNCKVPHSGGSEWNDDYWILEATINPAYSSFNWYDLYLEYVHRDNMRRALDKAGNEFLAGSLNCWNSIVVQRAGNKKAFLKIGNVMVTEDQLAALIATL